MVKPNGLLIIGEPYWLKDPDDEYLKISGMKKEEFNSHFKNIDIGEKKGLNCIYTLVSDHNDWDHYETLQWWSADDYIITNPNDPDNSELLNNIKKAKMEYLLYGRDTLGWAIYVFKNCHYAHQLYGVIERSGADISGTAHRLHDRQGRERRNIFDGHRRRESAKADG